MERTITANAEPEKIKWKKLGGGSLRIGKRIIKPNQIFIASIDEIPRGLRDLVRPVDPTIQMPVSQPGKQGSPAPNPAQSLPPVKVTPPVYKVQPRANSNTWFDVVDGQGKVLNEKALTKVIADKLVEDLLK